MMPRVIMSRLEIVGLLPYEFAVNGIDTTSGPWSEPKMNMNIK